jgi:ATP-dependent RNA helicase SUPV3L1/SUV3
MSGVQHPQNVKAVLGPTNTGKTHLAVERMLAHASGMIGLPLRLLAREIYDKVVAAKGAGAAALITGEEKIAPEHARFFICTVEAMPLDRRTEFLAIDEIQLARDPDRGHVFTERILHARGSGETMLLGSDAMRPMLRKLVPRAEYTHRERLSHLSYVGQRKISKLPKRSAIVAFSAEEVYAIAELIRRHRGGAAVVMGALSPRTRNAQVALYQSGEVDFLVATDAIGMGLNMDVEHVAFASMSKFDGHRRRVLRPDEIAQIAGRAGRFRTDGSFGETGECAPLDEETIERVEAHEFEAVDAVWWRNERLRFDTIAALTASLNQRPDQPGLMRVRGADDEAALKHVGGEAEIADLVRSPAAVRRLWEACQLPDFRKVSQDEHARLVARLSSSLLKQNGRVSEDWIAAEIKRLDQTEGDLDALQNRLAHVRTWSYVANRSDWLADTENWRGRARELEDKLSDALHALLQQRFIDRRTSALLKGLKREDVLLAGVSAEGEVTVEGHYVGRLEGLDFKPDPRALGLEGRAVRNAAVRALRPEVSKRLDELARGVTDIELGRDGRVRVKGEMIARLAPSAALAPKLVLIGAEDAGEAKRAAALAPLQAWLDAAVARELKPLVALEAAWREGRLPASARGLAFRLIEAGGALDRAQSPEPLPEMLDDAACAALSKLGVRLGRHSFYFPALIKPRPAHLHALLRYWTQEAPPKETHRGPLFLPKPGALSAKTPGALSPLQAAAAGYRLFSGFAVRFDRLEALAEALRAARGAMAGKEGPVDPSFARLIGRPASDLSPVMLALGYKRTAEAKDGAPELWRAPDGETSARKATRRPPTVREDSPFAGLAEMLAPNSARSAMNAKRREAP